MVEELRNQWKGEVSLRLSRRQLSQVQMLAFADRTTRGRITCGFSGRLLTVLVLLLRARELGEHVEGAVDVQDVPVCVAVNMVAWFNAWFLKGEYPAQFERTSDRPYSYRPI